MSAHEPFDAPQPHVHRCEIFDEVVAERDRQDILWGEQNHPSLPENPCTVANCTSCISASMGMPTEREIKKTLEHLASKGGMTWAHIALEELVEVVSAKTAVERRKELVQLTAVLFAWIECLDRTHDREVP